MCYTTGQRTEAFTQSPQRHQQREDDKGKAIIEDMHEHARRHAARPKVEDADDECPRTNL